MYNTGNPIPSAALEDMADNAQVFDNFVNSSSTTTTNRNGASVKTRAGFEADHDSQIATHENEHDAQMQAFESDFDGRLARMAFTRVGSFTTGVTLTDMRQVLVWEASQGGDGHEYGWTGSFSPSGKVVIAGSSPETTGGIGAGAWVDRTDVTLRSDLAAITGAGLVGTTDGITVQARLNAIDSVMKGRVGTDGGLSFRNKIVDGRFDFWYEAASQTTSGYGSDTMFQNLNDGSTKVHSQQALVAGVDLPCIEVPTAKYFSRTVVTSVVGSNNRALKCQSIESVSTLSGKTVTFSFYAKADSVKNIAVDFYQGFGYGGSPSSGFGGIGSQLVQLSTVWKRYSVTTTLPSIAGKTLGTSGSDALTVNFWFDAGTSWNSRTANMGQQSGTFDIACVQLEEGSVATPFEELPVSVAYDILNRYFVLMSVNGGYTSGSTGYTSRDVYFRTIMRTSPTVTFGTGYTNGVWSNQGYIKVDDDDTTSNAVVINSDIEMLRIIKTANSSDGHGIRATFIADARL